MWQDLSAELNSGSTINTLVFLNLISQSTDQFEKYTFLSFSSLFYKILCLWMCQAIQFRNDLYWTHASLSS